MNKYLVILFLLIFSFQTHAQLFPQSMTSNEREKLLPYFSNSYAQQVMSRPYFLGSNPGLEIGTSISYKNLADLEKEFPSDDIRDELILTQLFIKKSLIHRLELTISSSLTSLGTTQASGFGGVLTWHPLNLEQFYLSPVISIFTNYLNFEDTLSSQESGLQFILGKNFKHFSIKGGSSLSQIVARFSGTNKGNNITDTGNTEKNRIYVQTYFASIHIEFEQYLLTFTQNYVIDGGWNPTVIASYQF